MEKVSGLLKAFVLGAGVLLLVGTLALGVLIVLRATGVREASAPLPGQPVDLPLPAGARIEQVVPGEGRVLLLGVDGSGTQFLAVIEPETGRRLALIRMRPDG